MIWRNLNLSLHPLTKEEAAKAPMALTPIGKLGRYIFLNALYLYCKAVGNEDYLPNILKVIKEDYKNLFVSTAVYGPGFKHAMRVFSYWKDPASFKLDSVLLRLYYRDFVKEDPKYNQAEKELFVKSLGFLSKEGMVMPSGLATLEKIAWAVSPSLGEIFNDSVNKVSSVNSSTVKNMFTNLKELAKQLGSSTLKLDPKISENAKKKPNLASILYAYQDQLKAIKKTFDAVFKKETINGPIEAKKLEDRFKALGFDIIFFPLYSKGFRGLIGQNEGKLALYTSTGDLLFGGIHPDSKITMTKDYDPKTDNTSYLSYTAPGAVSVTRVYTAKYRNTANEEKHQSTEANLGNTGKWIAAWQRDLKSKDLMRKVPAVVAYILYMTGARVGTSKESTSLTGKGRTHGISTLRVSHVKVTGTSIDMKYIGKKQVAQHHVLKIADDPYLKICASVITALKKGKKPDDLLFSFVRPTSKIGAIQEVNPAFFNKYMKSVGVTHVHGMRHVRGTLLAAEILNGKPWKPSAKAKTLRQRQIEADKYIKEKVLTKVGELLGHKSAKNGTVSVLWSTSIKSYINPKVISDWYKSKDLVVPKWVPSKLETD